MKKFYLGVTSALAMSLLFSISALAATITQVDFYTTFDDNDSLSTSPVDLEFETASSEYTISYECTSSSSTGKNEATYKLTFSAESGYEFPSSASAVSINGTGINSITSSKVTDDGETLEVKVKAYQLVQISAPSSVEESGTSLTWSSDTSGTFEYVIVWEDYDGETQEKHGTTTSKSVSTKSYNKEKPSSSSSDKQDRKVTGYWVRQTKINNSSNPYIVPSDWEGSGDEPGTYDISNYETWGDYLSIDSSSTSQSATIGPSTSSSSSAHWSGSNASGWYYYREDGSLQTGWLNTGGKWYSLDSTGLMRTGWFQDSDGQWYYLNPSTTSGVYGEMLTGWQYIGNYWYYMRPAGTQGTEGAMLQNTSVSINGTVYNFNSDGVCTNP